ncbi:hypothetical protein GB937_002551 [Aspergillus fischeri]|nr:hypothetical protein GB937_002551 [Aspergillus fischeri]
MNTTSEPYLVASVWGLVAGTPLPPLSALPAAQQPFAYQRRCCTARFVSTNLGWLDEVSSMGRAVSHGLQKELVFLYVFLIHSLWFPWTGRDEDFFGSAYWSGTEP